MNRIEKFFNHITVDQQIIEDSNGGENSNASSQDYQSFISRNLSVSSFGESNSIPSVGSISVLKPININPKTNCLIPSGYIDYVKDIAPESLSHVQFLLQKDEMGQDSFLIGPPGIHKRLIAMAYCELARREVEVVVITQDTTVGDIKQRREIENGTIRWIDGPAVRAALEGRVLILDGVEKAERNVLSVLNNLLENREMYLEDGRFLTAPNRFDSLASKSATDNTSSDGSSTPAFDGTNSRNLKDVRLVRVSDRFRVVALGLPVPAYDGSPLDPPFRSRFQCRDIRPLSYHSSLRFLSALKNGKLDSDIMESKVYDIMNRVDLIRNALDAVENISVEGLPSRWLRRTEFPREAGNTISQIIKQGFIPPLVYLLGAVYPHPSLPIIDPLHRKVIQEVFERYGALPLSPLPRIPIGNQPQKPADLEQAASPIPDLSDFCGYVTASIKMKRENIKPPLPDSQPYSIYEVEFVQKSSKSQDSALSSFRIDVPGGMLRNKNLSNPSSSANVQFIPLEHHMQILTQMMVFHASGMDMTIVGPRGSGKSIIVHEFARLLGYDIRVFPLWHDLSTHDLFMRRTTRPNGDTIWMPSPLVEACLEGGLVVLDGIEQVPPGTLSSLQSLLLDRFATLPDGRRLVSAKEFNSLVERSCEINKGSSREKETNNLYANGIFPVHPNFRIICVARPQRGGAGASESVGPMKSWLTAEVVSSYRPFIWLRSLHLEEEQKILSSLLKVDFANQAGEASSPNKAVSHESIQSQVKKLLELAHDLRQRTDDESRSIASSLSTRQLLRISRRLAANAKVDDDLQSLIQHACLWRFLPMLAQETLLNAMKKVGIKPTSFDATTKAREAKLAVNLTLNPEYAEKKRLKDEESKRFPVPVVHDTAKDFKTYRRKSSAIIGKLKIGDISSNIYEPQNEVLIPDTLFFENPRQTVLLQNMLIDFDFLAEHLLLIGNQGVGKNKIVDRFLHLMKLPREYIQLDRDTTVNHLTSQPIVVNGVVKYEDSPLVKAASMGHILVVDEADKAPTHVTSILKSLLADGEMLLADGRRLVSHDFKDDENASKYIKIHPDFRAIILANRPGYPFLGNDFFREIGDIFSVVVVDNPDEESEILLLKKYGPKIPEDTLRKLSVAFQDLRSLVDQGKLTYPYSTRELVGIVRHMQLYPRDGMATILQNIFDFDQYSQDDKQLIKSTFEKHGIPISLDSGYKINTGSVTPLPPPVLSEIWKRSLSTKSAEGVAHACPFRVIDLPWRKNSLNPSNPYLFEGLVSYVSENVKLNRSEGRANTFDERLFSFRLPTVDQAIAGPSIGVIGLTTMSDNSILVAANDAYNALRFYRIHPGSMRAFDCCDIILPHFNFRDEVVQNVRRPSPGRCSLAALPNSRVAVLVHDDQTIYVIDFVSRTLSLLLVPMDVFRKAQRPAQNGKDSSSPGLWMERQRTVLVSTLSLMYGVMVLYQQESAAVIILNLQSETCTVVNLPCFINRLDIASPWCWLITEAMLIPKGNSQSKPSSEYNGDTRVFVLHAEGERITSGKTYGTLTNKDSRIDMEIVSNNDDDGGDAVANDYEPEEGGMSYSGLRYDKFIIEPVLRKHTISQDSDVTKISKRLHGEYEFVSSAMLPNPVIRMTETAGGRRTLYSKGTISQILNGLSEVFDYHGAVQRAITESSTPGSKKTTYPGSKKNILRSSSSTSNSSNSNNSAPTTSSEEDKNGSKQGNEDSNTIQNECHIESYLRTSLTAVAGSGRTEFCAGTLFLNVSMQHANLFLRDSSFIPSARGKFRPPQGYFGYGHEGYLEVVDFDRQTVRVIKVPLTDTARRGNVLLRGREDDFNEAEMSKQNENEEYNYQADSDGSQNPIDQDPTYNSRFRREMMFVSELVDGSVLVVDRTGAGHVYQVDTNQIEEAHKAWQQMIGGGGRGDDDLDVEFGDEDDEEDEEEEDDDGEDGEEANVVEAEGEFEIVEGEVDTGEAEGEITIIKDKSKKGQGKGKGKGGKKIKAPGAGKGGRSRRSGSQNGGARRRQRSRGGSGGRQRGDQNGNQDGDGGQGSGSGNGSGSGTGGGGGGGKGGSGGGSGYISEPGQHRNKTGRPLSARERNELLERLDELRKLEKYFPSDDQIREEIARVERALEESDRAEADVDPNAEITSRLENARRRLQEIERQMQNGGTGAQDPRLRGEAQQLQNLIKNLEKELEAMKLNPDATQKRKKFEEETAEAKKIKEARKSIEEKNWKETLEKLKQNPQDVAIYSRYKDAVKTEIRELVSTLNAMEAKKMERVWLQNKENGDLDDRKLIDGLTGERNIYKRRGERPPEPFSFQALPKRLTFLFDVSSSMSHYGMDGRMERSLEAATMIMESFGKGQDRFQYKFKGHSGSTDNITFVEDGKYPGDDVAKLNVLRAMNYHSETCDSGDHTLAATRLAIQEITQKEADEYFVFVFSDANLQQYGISPNDLQALLNQDERVNVFIIFIGSMGKSAEKMREQLPKDKVFVTLSTTEIPKVLKRIFLSSVLKGA